MEQSKLIALLISNPKTEREIGFNDAIVAILKETNDLPYKTRDQLIYEHLNTMIPALYRLNQEQVIELAGFIARNEKLAFVKFYKDATGLGLREAKDFTDIVWPKFF